jgi:ABC-type proline/glycine betaine transport system permease subunit
MSIAEFDVPLAQDQPPTPRQNPRGRWRAGLLIRPAFLVLILLILFLYVHSQKLDSIEKRSINRHAIGTALGQHVRLCVIATAFVIVIAVPLGLLLTRRSARFLRPGALALGNLGQAIPSIGLLVLIAFWRGNGFWSAAIALVAYSILPVLRNTIVGLQQVDSALIEAGRGMGMSRTAILFRVELPLAVPVILAGIRTALVLTFATATLATFIGAGGLGDGLVAGIKLDRTVVILTYGVIVAVLALFFDWVGSLAENYLRPRGI